MQQAGDSDPPDVMKLLDLALEPECLPGVREALAGLEAHWRNVADFVVPDSTAL